MSLLLKQIMEKSIDRIPKNPDTDIVIRVDDFGGKRGVTIREFVRGERYTGFTKAGTRVPVEHFKAFKEAINSIKEEELMEGLAEMNKERTINERDSKGETKEDKISKGKSKTDKSFSENLDEIGEEEI